MTSLYNNWRKKLSFSQELLCYFYDDVLLLDYWYGVKYLGSILFSLASFMKKNTSQNNFSHQTFSIENN